MKLPQEYPSNPTETWWSFDHEERPNKKNPNKFTGIQIRQMGLEYLPTFMTWIIWGPGFYEPTFFFWFLDPVIKGYWDLLATCKWSITSITHI